MVHIRRRRGRACPAPGGLAWPSPRGGPRSAPAIALIVLAIVASVHAQMPAPVARVSFQDAIKRAVENNPSSTIAAAGILRAEALLAEARASTRLQINGSVATTTLNRGVEFQDTTVVPRNSVVASLDARLPLFAPARWARRAQAEDTKQVADLNADVVHRQTALSTADAYLTIIGRRRVVESSETARDIAKAHFDLAHELQQRGTGSRLNELRAQQAASIDEGLVESARVSLYRAQEALGVLLGADGPIDATDEPSFDSTPFDAADVQLRPDLKFFAAQQQAADRVLRDSAKDYWPYLEGVFQPQSTYPAQFFTPANSWRFLLQMSVPLFDSGQRKGQKLERQAAFDIATANLKGALTEARSEVRTAREAVASAERILASVRAAADQARQVVSITNISFRAGAATNIEVLDAQRVARDADLASAVAEDSLRRARLELLTALGRFP